MDARHELEEAAIQDLFRIQLSSCSRVDEAWFVQLGVTVHVEDVDENENEYRILEQKD